MPSPCSPKGGFYLRKGGGWKQTKNGQMKYVGYGKGTHSRRSRAAGTFGPLPQRYRKTYIVENAEASMFSLTGDYRKISG